MDASKAVTAYSQCEKIKAGLIWVSHTAQMIPAMHESEKRGAQAVLKSLAYMISDEAHLAGRVTNDPGWGEIGKHIHMAIVMIESGVAQETPFHLTKALSIVTRQGNEAMAILKQNGLA